MIKGFGGEMTRRISVLAHMKMRVSEENLDWSLDRVLERHVDAGVQTFVHFDFHLEGYFPSGDQERWAYR